MSEPDRPLSAQASSSRSPSHSPRQAVRLSRPSPAAASSKGAPAQPWRPPNASITPCRWFLAGYCARGDSCWFAHTSLSSSSAAPSSDNAAAAAPAEPAQPQDEAERPPCVICYDVPATYALLERCPHVVCLSCARDWREGKGKEPSLVDSGVTKCCPVCRERSWFVTPSHFHYASGPQKVAAIASYKASMARKPCRNFERSLVMGNGMPDCIFGDDCHYSHKLPGSDERYLFGAGATEQRARQAQRQRARALRRLLEAGGGHYLEEYMDWSGELGAAEHELDPFDEDPRADFWEYDESDGDSDGPWERDGDDEAQWNESAMLRHLIAEAEGEHASLHVMRRALAGIRAGLSRPAWEEAAALAAWDEASVEEEEELRASTEAQQRSARAASEQRAIALEDAAEAGYEYEPEEEEVQELDGCADMWGLGRAFREGYERGGYASEGDGSHDADSAWGSDFDPSSPPMPAHRRPTFADDEDADVDETDAADASLSRAFARATSVISSAGAERSSAPPRDAAADASLMAAALRHYRSGAPSPPSQWGDDDEP